MYNDDSTPTTVSSKKLAKPAYIALSLAYGIGWLLALILGKKAGQKIPEKTDLEKFQDLTKFMKQNSFGAFKEIQDFYIENQNILKAQAPGITSS
jgi:hypothetical protein